MPAARHHSCVRDANGEAIGLIEHTGQSNVSHFTDVAMLQVPQRVTDLRFNAKTQHEYNIYDIRYTPEYDTRGEIFFSRVLLTDYQSRVIGYSMALQHSRDPTGCGTLHLSAERQYSPSRSLEHTEHTAWSPMPQKWQFYSCMLQVPQQQSLHGLNSPHKK